MKSYTWLDILIRGLGEIIYAAGLVIFPRESSDPATRVKAAESPANAHDDQG